MRFEPIEIETCVPERCLADPDNPPECVVVLRLTKEPYPGWADALRQVTLGTQLARREVEVEGDTLRFRTTPDVFEADYQLVRQVVPAANDEFEARHAVAIQAQRELDRRLEQHFRDRAQGFNWPR